MENRGDLKFLLDKGNLPLDWLMKDFDAINQIFTPVNYTLQAKLEKREAAEDRWFNSRWCGSTFIQVGLQSEIYGSV